jgi:hypothetical protein
VKSVLAAVLIVLTSPAFADDLAGNVIVVGSSVNMRVLLTEKGAAEGPALCTNDVSKRIRKLLRLEVQVTGSWKMKDATNAKDCFEATSFKVLKHSSGRQPVIGILTEDGANYMIKGEDGRVSRLSDITSGLMKLKGKKVILDIKPMDAPGQKDISFKVVAYSEYPE